MAAATLKVLSLYCPSCLPVLSYTPTMHVSRALSLLRHTTVILAYHGYVLVCGVSVSQAPKFWDSILTDLMGLVPASLSNRVAFHVRPHSQAAD
jgi:hypothetical protein